MGDLLIEGIIHEFGGKGSGQVQLFALDCEGCERQRAISGLSARRAVVSGEPGKLRVESADSVSTDLYVADSLDTLRDAPISDLERHSLELARDVPFDFSDMTKHVLDQVARMRENGICLVKLANEQQTIALL